MAHWKLNVEGRTLFRVYNKQHAIELAADFAKKLEQQIVVDYVTEERKRPLPVACVYPSGRVEELYSEADAATIDNDWLIFAYAK